MTIEPKSTVPVIAIDGPSGTGKGTVAAHLAERLGWHILDSGALYRAFAYLATQRGLSADDIGGLTALERTDLIRFSSAPGGVQIWVAGRNVTDAVRGEEGGRAASVYAAVPAVRSALLVRQRAARRLPGLIADGRDMGTVVFPDAPIKVFLDATPGVRAKRRYKQLMEKGFSATLAAVEQEVSARDEKDRSRAVSPLEPAKDAVILDTSEIGIDQVVKKVDDLLTAKLAQGNNG